VASILDYFTKIPEDESKKSSVWEYLTPVKKPDGSRAERGSSVPCAVEFSEDHVFWAMRNTPVGEAVKHFLACGAIGTGKTTVIDLFIQSIAPRFRPGRAVPEQLIIFDAKGEIVPKLAALGFSLENGGPENNIWLFNPYDKRSAVWNLAKAVETPLMARHFASLVVPSEPKSNTPYFWTASRRLVYAVLLALTKVAGDRWQLRDLLCAFDSRERLLALTSRHGRAKALASSILNDSQHSDAVISSVATKLDQLEEVSALWYSARSNATFSISEFLKRPGILILGHDPVLEESLWPINAMLLKSLSQEILRRPDVSGPRHWFVLDEFPAMHRVPAIHALVNRGRSKGASVVIGIQGIDRLNELYQETGANDLLEQCSNKTFFRAGGPKTAEWIERYFGKYRRTEATYTATRAGRQRSESVQFQTVERPLFLASFFMNLPLTGRGRSIVAVNDVSYLNATLITKRSFDEVNAWRIPARRDIRRIWPRDGKEDQVFVPWDEVEEQSFCGSVTSQESASGTQPKSGRKRKLPRRGDRWPNSGSDGASDKRS